MKKSIYQYNQYIRNQPVFWSRVEYEIVFCYLYVHRHPNKLPPNGGDEQLISTGFREV